MNSRKCPAMRLLCCVLLRLCWIDMRFFRVWPICSRPAFKQATVISCDSFQPLSLSQTSKEASKQERLHSCMYVLEKPERKLFLKDSALSNVVVSTETLWFDILFPSSVPVPTLSYYFIIFQ